MVGAAFLRGAEYDEGYTLFVTAGTPRPNWPDHPFQAQVGKDLMARQAGLGEIAHILRTTDVHPPLYFWALAAWRELFGPSLKTARLASVVLALAGLAVVSALASRSGISANLAVLFTAGCYGYAYTGAIARGFALAQALTLLGTWLAMRQAPAAPAGKGERVDSRVSPTAPSPRPRLPEPEKRPPSGGAPGALAAGLLLGAATLANYLAVFCGMAVLAWLLRTRWRAGVAACLGFALVLPADLYFFLAQRNSRPGQFPPFDLWTSLGRLARYAGGSVFGALPLYAGSWATAASASLGALMLGVAALIWARRKAIGNFGLLALSATAPPIGLLTLGLAFNNTPIELRYLSFATPFAALLAAGAIGSVPRRFGIAVGSVVLVLQAASIAGLMTRPETMQPQESAGRSASRAAEAGLVLTPHGNDGVGIVAALIQGVSADASLGVVRRGDLPEHIRAQARGFQRVALALLGLDDDSRAALSPMRAAFAEAACWRQAGAWPNVEVYTRVCQE